MGKVNVYLPDELERAVRDSRVPLSAVCQDALRGAVRAVTALRSDPDIAAVTRPRITTRLAEVLATGPANEVDLLGAILLHGENLGARVMTDLGVDLPRPRGSGTTGDEIDPPTAVREALAAGYLVALDMHHEHLGTEHVVIALAQPDASTSDLFTALGLDDRAVRARVAMLIDNPWRTDAAPSESDGARVEDLFQRFEAELQRLAGELAALREGLPPSDR